MTDNATPMPGTALPWEAREDEDYSLVLFNPNEGDCLLEGHLVGPYDAPKREANAAYIVWACNNAPALLSALEEALQTLWQYKNDLHYPPDADSMGRRLARISEVAFKAESALASAGGRNG